MISTLLFCRRFTNLQETQEVSEKRSAELVDQIAQLKFNLEESRHLCSSLEGVNQALNNDIISLKTSMQSTSDAAVISVAAISELQEKLHVYDDLLNDERRSSHEKESRIQELVGALKGTEKQLANLLAQYEALTRDKQTELARTEAEHTRRLETERERLRTTHEALLEKAVAAQAEELAAIHNSDLKYLRQEMVEVTARYKELLERAEARTDELSISNNVLLERVATAENNAKLAHETSISQSSLKQELALSKLQAEMLVEKEAAIKTSLSSVEEIKSNFRAQIDEIKGAKSKRLKVTLVTHTI